MQTSYGGYKNVQKNSNENYADDKCPHRFNAYSCIDRCVYGNEE